MTAAAAIASPPDAAAALRDVWYFVLPGSRLPRGRMLARTLLGERLLLGRDAAGVPFALRDICPHRGIPLTYGRFDGTEIECCYHGWRFDCAGRCTAIPSLAAGQQVDFARIKVPAYAVREVHGNLWVFMGDDPADAPAIPEIAELGDRPRGFLQTIRVAGTMDNAVLGLIDPAHVSFVHRSRWWHSRKPVQEKAKSFVPSAFGFTMARHAPSKNWQAYRILPGRPETEISFALPGTRVEHTRVGAHVVCNLTTITPVSEGEIEMTHAIYWTMPWLFPFKPLMRLLMRSFLAQDRLVLQRHDFGARHGAAQLLPSEADTQIKWYFRLKREYARSRTERRAFANPLKGRTLRWRS